MKIMANYYYNNKGIAMDINGNDDWGAPTTLNTELNGSSFYGNNKYIDAIHRKHIIYSTWYTGKTKNESTTTYFGNFVSNEKNTSALAHIGLISVVDFGYGSNTCENSIPISGSNSNENLCTKNNWINSNTYQWTITPATNCYHCAWYINMGANVQANAVDNNYKVRPSVYLDSDVKITGGSGTENNPYILSK